MHALIISLAFSMLSDPQSSDGKIAFSRLTDGFWQIWTMGPDGESPKQLTSGASDKRNPSWAPDGDFLVYVDSNGLLYRINRDGGSPTRILAAQSPISEPAFSPDGQIAYTHVQYPPSYTVEVWTSDLQGMRPRVLTQPPLRELQPCWSPDGRRLAVIQYDMAANLNTLVLMNAEGAARLPLIAGKEALTKPRWSPNGKTIAYSAEQNGNLDIFLANVDDPKPRRLTDDSVADISPAFSPDGREIVFVSRRSGSLQLWKIPLGGGEARLLTTGVEPCRDPDWSRPRINSSLHFTTVQVSSNPFEPAKAKQLDVSFALTEKAEVVLQIRDCARRFVRRIAEGKAFDAGPVRLSWDGLDQSGKRVSEGIYLISLLAANEKGCALWDPSAETGGTYFFAQDLKLDDATRTISFRMPQAGLARIRSGLSVGAMLENLADWEIFPAGAIQIPYAGELPDPWGNFWDRSDRYAWVSTYSLPENGVFVRGETSPESLGRRPTIYEGSERDLSVHVRHRPSECGDFPLSVGFVGNYAKDASKLPIIDGEATIRIDAVTPAARTGLENARFEIAIYLDGIAISEEEDSALPLNYRIDCSRFSEGVHSLLVNVASYQDHYGVAFAPFRIDRSLKGK